MALPENENGNEEQGPVIRDKRRIDPDTGELRTPEGVEEESEATAESAEPEVAVETPVVDNAELDSLRQEVAERTDDLKRLQAEYVNYRKRVDRDRVVVREQALVQVLGELLPILDDVGRARAHDELTGGFKSVGESLEGLVTKLGLQKYGEQGDEFDPNVHEALTMVPTPGVSTPTVIEVFQPGYLIGERVLRPARVVVGGPTDEEPEAPAAEETPEVTETTGSSGSSSAAKDESDGEQ